MRNFQTPLLTASMMTPIERSMGRFMRAPDHPGAAGGGEGGNGAGDGNNGGGNNGQSGSDSNNQNNDGQPLDLNAFWNGEPGADGKSPSGESDDGKPASGSSPTAAATPNIAEQIQSMSFGEFMTPDVIEKMGEGDMSGFNAGLQGFGQTVMRQTLALSVGIMKQLREQIFAEVEGKIDGRVTGDRQHDALIAAIPSAGKPEMGPTIKNIYARALTNQKGNVEKAIEQTKQVLQLQAEAFGGDLGLNVAPKTVADSYAPPKTTNWLESLAGN